MHDSQLQNDDWPPAGCPPLDWPELPDAAARLAWYRAVIAAYGELWAGHATAPCVQPVTETALAELEARLDCRLPADLRQWHGELGVLALAETLCSVAPDGATPIEPLLDAFPAIADLCDDDPELLALAGELVAFGDYLGNGNLFCFHRTSGEVYYFDHDDGALLTPMFPAVADYLDALMIRTLAEIHEDDVRGEALLAERIGPALVRKWLY